MAVSYDALAPHFDAWQRSHGGPYDDLVRARVETVLACHAPAARRILDLGIGTGDLAIALARRGFDVVGVDRAPAMLAVAREKAEACGVTLGLVEQDLRDVRLRPPADVALCIYTVVNQLTDEGDLGRAFASVRAALVPAGLFVFELNLPASYARYWQAEEIVDVGDAVIIRTHRPVPGTAVIEAAVEIRRRTGCGWDVVEDRIVQRPFDDATIEAAIATAGFVVVECQRYDPFAAGAEPTKALWVCRRA
jgi:SAM-dependent methyltransferase